MNVHRVRSAGEPAFDGLLQIYKGALPASERKSVDALRQMIERPEYLFLTVDDSDAVVGFAIAIALAGCDAALLEYMAVDEKRRGRGIGKLLFRAIAGWPAVHQRTLLIEVESSEAASPEAENRERRNQSYRRLGCRQIEGLTYVMPRVSAEAPPAMDMLVYRPELPADIEKPRLRAWLEACYAHVYQQQLPDARIEAMLQGLPDRIAIG
jgi:GNAT superfamily N-acetyltransferase